jgi:hypothetical protein
MISSNVPRIHELWALPLQVLLLFALLYYFLGLAFLAGVIIIVVMIPVNSRITAAIGRATASLLKHKDQRLQIFAEALAAAKALKMLALEGSVPFVLLLFFSFSFSFSFPLCNTHKAHEHLLHFYTHLFSTSLCLLCFVLFCFTSFYLVLHCFPLFYFALLCPPSCPDCPNQTQFSHAAYLVSQYHPCCLSFIPSTVETLASEARAHELKYLGRRKYLDALCVLLWACMPILVPLVTFAAVASWENEAPSQQALFTSLGLLGQLVFPMNGAIRVLRLVNNSFSLSHTHTHTHTDTLLLHTLRYTTTKR